MAIFVWERSSWTTASWPFWEAIMSAVPPNLHPVCINGDIPLREKQRDDCVVAIIGCQHECCPTDSAVCVLMVIFSVREKQLDDCVVAIIGSQHECCPTIFSLCVNVDIRLGEKQLEGCGVAILDKQT
jgi:hypothetical protein